MIKHEDVFNFFWKTEHQDKQGPHPEKLIVWVKYNVYVPENKQYFYAPVVHGDVQSGNKVKLDYFQNREYALTPPE